jgi:FKBP-type peptidyl-prolyl cis-trans isomerase FkpA
MRIATKISASVMAITLVAYSFAVSAADEKSEEDKVLYFLGTKVGQNMETLNLSERETAALLDGLRDTFAGKAEEMDDAVYTAKLNELTQARMAVVMAKEQAIAQEYLTKMAAEKGAVTTASGLIYLEVKAGSGAQPTAASSVKAHYTGTLRDGTVFDSSHQRGQPLTIPLNQVIPCWTEAIAMMKEGGKAKITCPAAIAYGERGSGSGSIPPGAVISFEVDLIEVIK